MLTLFANWLVTRPTSGPGVMTEKQNNEGDAEGFFGTHGVVLGGVVVVGVEEVVLSRSKMEACIVDVVEVVVKVLVVKEVDVDVVAVVEVLLSTASPLQESLT
mmetsp:Transcript_88634/g.275551  ORF Transcript_88634/g.275551 Transcript_88634/m.275551 type:complete len:103 (-) Transcript_88634:354-662(-)